MNQLHKKLSESSPLYRAWHQTTNVSVLHFFILAVISTFVAHAIFITVAVPPEYLTATSINSQNNNTVALSQVLGFAGDHILVKFKTNAGQTRRAQVMAEKKLKTKSRINDIDVDVLSIDPSDTPDAVIQDLLTNPKYKNDIEFAEKDALVAPSAPPPNDPSFPSEWNKIIVNLPTAWSTTTGSPSIIVGIADTGVDCTHPDLAANCVPGWNFYNNNSDTHDVYGHGTSVAGVIDAVGNNGVGLAGSAWHAQIMPLRISDTLGNAYTSTVITAITYAADHGAKVVNLSYGPFGGGSFNNALQYLWNKGTMLAEAEGNSGADSGQSGYLLNRIMVSGTDSNNNRYSWSTYGADNDLSAPGCSPVTTANGGGYRSFCGTSNATPEVSGLLALMFSANPALTPQNAVNALYASALDLGTPGWDKYYGWGRIQADKAVADAITGVPPPPDTRAPWIVGINSLSSKVSSNQIFLWWGLSQDNVGVTGYNVYRNGVKIATVTNDTYVDTAVQPQTTYSYTVSAFDAAGNTSAQILSPLLVPFVATTPAFQPNAPVVTLTANPTSGVAGTVNPTITWSATNNPTSCTAAGYWSGTKSASGSTSVGVLAFPSVPGATFLSWTYYYNLTCTNASGSDTKTVTVDVSTTPSTTPVVSITANPTSGTINVVNPSLSWSATNNPTSCTASGDWSGVKAVSGTSVSQGVLNTVKTYTYTLTCINASGSGTNSATVVVNSPPVTTPVVSISANPTNGIAGIVNPALTWSVINGPSSCTASGDWSGTKPVSGSAVSMGVLSTVKTYMYTLTCANASGSGTRSTSVAVTAAPLPDLTAAAPTPATATVGTALTFSSTVKNNGTASTVNGFSDLFQVATAAGGGGTVSTLSVSTSPLLSASASGPITSSPYTFTSAGTFSVRACADNNASLVGTITESNEGNNCSPWTNIAVSNTVTPPGPTLVSVTVFPASATLGYGQSLQFTATAHWSDNSVTSPTVSWASHCGSITTSGVYTSISTCGAVTLPDGVRATFNGITGSAQIKLQAAPVSAAVASISANPTSIISGQSSTLTWTRDSATYCTATGGWSGSITTGGSKVVTPTTTTIYTLSCTSAGGTATSSATVTVN